MKGDYSVMPMTPNEIRQAQSAGSDDSWARTPDRSARTAPGRRAFYERFYNEARELHPDATDEQIAQAAESLRKAHFKRMALESARSRRLAKEYAEAAEAADAELAELAEAGDGDAA